MSITQADQRILLALSRYHYLTAFQASRLLYPRLADENRYLQRRLKRLVDALYVLRLRALPTPRYGQAPHVFTLHQRGRQYLKRLGVPVTPYFRPAEERQAARNNPFIRHRLAAIDVLVAVDLLCRDAPVTCPRLLPERELRQHPIRVTLSTTQGTRTVAVIPDGWFQLCVAGGPAYSIALELDRGTEDQRAWRTKVAGYVVWSQGPYRQAFATDNLTIAIVTTIPQRQEQLRTWTMRELTACGVPQLADLFVITTASPVTTHPLDFFFQRRWFQPQQPEPVALLDVPATVAKEVTASPHEVLAIRPNRASGQ